MALQNTAHTSTPDNENLTKQPIILEESTSTEVPWFRPEIGDQLKPPVRKLFEEYSNIPSKEVVSHISKIRNQAWATRPYPCIGSWAFITSVLPGEAVFQVILSKLQSGATMLDIGSCFGQELRFLAAAGTPTENMYATDLISDFWPVGYDLFQDKHKFQATFIKDDFLSDWTTRQYGTSEDNHADPPERGQGLERLKGKVDVMYAGAFLHLFDWKQQVQAAQRIVALSRPGTILAGYQIGAKSAEDVQTGWGKGSGSKLFYHNRESFEKMWTEAGQATKTKWKVDVEEKSFEEVLGKGDYGWAKEGTCLIMFVVTRDE